GGGGGDDLGVLHWLHTGHRRHQRDGGLAAAGDHVDVHRAGLEVVLEVDRRHAIRADGGRGQVDHQHAQCVELAAVLGVHVGRGGVEGDLDVVFQHVLEQAVDAVAGGLQAHLAGAGQALGGGVD